MLCVCECSLLSRRPCRCEGARRPRVWCPRRPAALAAPRSTRVPLRSRTSRSRAARYLLACERWLETPGSSLPCLRKRRNRFSLFAPAVRRSTPGPKKDAQPKTSTDSREKRASCDRLAAGLPLASPASLPLLVPPRAAQRNAAAHTVSGEALARGGSHPGRGDFSFRLWIEFLF